MKTGRKAIVIALGMVPAAAGAIMLLALGQGSSWHSYFSDQPLGTAERSRLQAVREELAGRDAPPRVLTWLDLALASDTGPTEVRLYLLSAQEALTAMDDPALEGAARELQAIAQTIRPASGEATPWLSAPTPVHP